MEQCGCPLAPRRVIPHLSCVIPDENACVTGVGSLRNWYNLQETRMYSVELHTHVSPYLSSYPLLRNPDPHNGSLHSADSGLLGSHVPVDTLPTVWRFVCRSYFFTELKMFRNDISTAPPLSSLTLSGPVLSTH